MNEVTNFRDVVKPILNRYALTSLVARWEEATAYGLKPLAFWIRESNDLVNIVWMNKSGVWDITWFPQSKLSTFNFSRLSTITGFDIRAGEDVAKQTSLVVAGTYAVEVFASSGRGGGFLWVANGAKEEAELGEFVSKLTELLLEV